MTHRLWRTMHPTNFTILDQWFNFLTSHLPLHIDFTIYLRSQPQNLMKRLKKRNRIEDSLITEQILKTTHELHENWLIKKQYPSRGRLIVLNANKTSEEMMIELDKKLRKSYIRSEWQRDGILNNDLFENSSKFL